MLNIYDFLKSRGDDFKKLSFKDFLFVHYRCPTKEHYVSLYTHLNFFVYVLNGRKVYHQPGYAYPLSEGTCAFIRKGGHRQEQFFDEDWVVMTFFVHDNYLQGLLTEYRASLPSPVKEVPADEQVIRLHVNDLSRAFFNSMVPYFFQADTVAEQLVEIKFREMLFQLLSDPQNRNLLSYVSRMDGKQSSLQEVMEANYRYNLSLGEYARIANRSLSTFKREFLAVYGVPPGKWLLNKRLDQAELLLTHSDKPMTEIADESGFENQSHFNRTFKERFGASPLQYRIQSRSGAGKMRIS